MHNSMESDWDQNVSGQKRELCVFSVSIPAIWKFFYPSLLWKSRNRVVGVSGLSHTHPKSFSASKRRIR